MGWLNDSKEERRKKMLNKLKQFNHIGMLENVKYEDFNFLFESGWELIAATDSRTASSIFYFKKR